MPDQRDPLEEGRLPGWNWHNRTIGNQQADKTKNGVTRSKEVKIQDTLKVNNTSKQEGSESSHTLDSIMQSLNPYLFGIICFLISTILLAAIATKSPLHFEWGDTIFKLNEPSSPSKPNDKSPQ